MEGHRLEALNPLDQRDLLVGVPEKAGIVEAGAQDALIAVADDRPPFSIHFGIQHGEEMGSERGLRILDSEVFLVVAHHGDQNFFGQRQVFGLETAA